MENNEISSIRRQRGRPRKIVSSELLLKQFVAYAQHVEDNPFLVDTVFKTERGLVHAKLRKARPMTISGLCLYLGITMQAWQYWRRNRIDLLEATELIDDAVFVHKYEGAAA